MPHFIIECSENVLNLQEPSEILNNVYHSAMSTGLFDKLKNVKVRIQPYNESLFTSYGTKEDFIHVFGHIMGGRSIEQKANLSETVVRELKQLLPNVPTVSMNIYEFEPETYRNGQIFQ